jgi:hypothetical protein
MKDWLRSGINLSGVFVTSNRGATTTSNSIINPFNFARGIGPIYPVRAYNTSGQPVLDIDGNHVYDYGLHTGAINRPGGAYPGRHVVFETLLDERLQIRNSIIGRTFLEASFLRDFTATTNVGIDLNNYRTKTFRNKTVGDGVTSAAQQPGSLMNTEPLL